MTKEELYAELKAMKPELTPDERIAEYLKGNDVDCIPYAFLAPDDALAVIWGYSKGDLRRSFEARCNMIERKKAEYGFTGLSISMGLRGIGEAAGSILKYPENKTDYVEKYVADNYDNIDLSEPLNVHSHSILMNKLENGKRMMERFPTMGISTDVAGPITTASAIRPVELILRDMRKNPEKLNELLQYSVDSSLEWVKVFVEETGSRSVGISDPVTSTDVLGYKYFLEYSQPYFDKLFSGIVQITGEKPSVHICGHTKKIWKDLQKIGVDNFSIDNCEDMEEAKCMIGDSVFLSGNIPPVDVMLNGSIDDVIEAVRTTIAKAADSPNGFMLMTGCQVPMGTPKENMDAYVYAAQKYGAGAKLGKIPEALNI
ncbi:uroporphyrinogen decarboxylase family protein [Dorea sp. AM58-8]|uniref:uroporphyrinogen decarboxylase family protein n=1 Tax=Dorea sp. AM58-8 TaxID=2292346 RepID=UPI000E53C379|nr:uroporphyrinogen decarboxylase family protein [Dorea sp. AM58-8]RGY81692.1 uroporphyrinogen decarboxylase [Dorea sp. AM58-8]